MATINDARAELVRSRAFIRGAETQLSKALAALDAIGAEPDPSTPEPEVPEPEGPTPEPEKPDPPFEVSLGGALLSWTPYPDAAGYRVGFVSVAGSQTQTLPATMTSVAIPDGSPAGEITVTVLLAAGDGPGDSVQWVPPAVPESPAPEPESPVVVPPPDGVPMPPAVGSASILADLRMGARPPQMETRGHRTVTIDGHTAFAFNYRAQPGRLSEQEAGPSIYFSRGEEEIVAQWTNRFGRHPADTGGLGAVGAFRFHGGQSNWGRKHALFFAPADNASGRCDLLFPGPAGQLVCFTRDHTNGRWNGNADPRQWEGETVTFTVRVKGGAAGRVQAWATWDGQTREIVPLQAASLGARWEQMRTPSVQASNAIDMTEYLWDLVVWRP